MSYHEVAKVELAMVEQLWSAPINALSVLCGCEAKNIMLVNKLVNLRRAQQARRAKMLRSGRVELVRAYTQAEINDMRKL